MNTREKDYASLKEPIAIIDVARELGVPVSFVRAEIVLGHLEALPGELIEGSELARFLAARRQG
jgi:hypothetical protein